jgi:hypothetical protein
MSTLGFPTNPVLNQTYTVGNTVYIWTGNAWVKYSGLTQTTSTVYISNSTTSVSTDSGALVVNGGVGISGSVNAGSTSTINGAVILTTATLINYLTTGTDISITTDSSRNVVISNISTLQSVTDRGATTGDVVSFTNTTASTSTTTGAVVVTGGVGVRGDVYIGGTVFAEHVQIAEAIMDSSYIEVNTTLSTVIDSYPTNLFRSSKYLIQIDEGTGPTANFEVIELLLLVTNTGTVLATDYGLITNNGELGEFTTLVDGSDPFNPLMKLFFTAYEATDKTITVLRTGVTK